MELIVLLGSDQEIFAEYTNLAKISVNNDNIAAGFDIYVDVLEEIVAKSLRLVWLRNALSSRSYRLRYIFFPRK